MFDLDLKKIPVERIYPTSTDVTRDLLYNLNQEPEVVIVGAGNQPEQAFSSKTLAIVEKSKYSVFVVKNSRFSNIHARYFWNVIASRLKENPMIYRLYRTAYGLVKSRRRQTSPEDYFEAKL